MKLIKSKLLMSLLKQKGGSNNKQLLIKLINSMIRKSYKEFIKKRGGNILQYSFIGNRFRQLPDKSYIHDNTYNYNNIYDTNKFDNVVRSSDGYIDNLSDSRILNTWNLDYNRDYDVSKPLRPER